MSRFTISPRGTYDLLPAESSKWAYIEKQAQILLNQATFREIRTPIFEATEVFQRSAGFSSDIVNKEMYTFLDRSERSLTLRPEGTAGIVRAFLSNGLDRTVKPLKLWYLGPMFRYERSQTGRYRQFHQLGLEILGAASVNAELEGIYLAWQLFQNLGLTDLHLEINSLGDQESRLAYQKAMYNFLQTKYEQICSDCRQRMLSNPLRVLDCKVPADRELYEHEAPKLFDYLSQDSKEHFQQLQKYLKEFKIPFVHNSNLVRGLDYYTQTVFEITTSDENLGTQNTICAGGRYDHLVEEFGGPATPAFGWALGMERLVLLLADRLPIPAKPDFAIIYPEGQFSQALSFGHKLRLQNYQVSLEYQGYRSQSQRQKMLKRALDQQVQAILFFRPAPDLFLQCKINTKYQLQNYYESEAAFWQDLAQ